MNEMKHSKGPVIGVFDSGFGGLTVLRALLPLIPGAHYVYLGDTARLPYGSKSQETIARYATTAARFLESQGAEFLVIACNTASALALEALHSVATVPVIGVIEPGAEAASAASRSHDVLVLATDATVQSHAYARVCASHQLRAAEKACPLLVPLVEEGWTEHPVTADVLRIYLNEALAQARESGLQPDTLVLGCTHYPLLRPLMERTLAELSSTEPLRVIDSAEATANRVLRQIAPSGETWMEPTCSFFATDSVAKFRTLGARFLGRPIEQVEHVDLGG
ncbi:MAG: glutamate racemase [Acidobacteriaceae bacterium]